MRTKILSLCLALCMFFSVAVTMSVTTSAEVEPTSPSNDEKSFADALAAGDTILNIDDTADWAAFVEAAATNDFAGKVIQLNLDIDANSGTEFDALTTTDFTGVTVWTSIPNFAGTLDGGNHTISDMYTTGAGFITNAKSATVKNITFKNCFVNSTTDLTGYGNNVGLVIANIPWDAGKTTVSNVHTVDSRVVGKARGVAGLVGLAGAATVLIENCTNGATVIGEKTTTGNEKWSAGGILGVANSTGLTLTGCVNTGDIDNYTIDAAVNNYAGGIIGRISAAPTKISDCENRGTIEGVYGAGGIVGNISYDNSVIQNCTNAGAVKALKGAGGIVGTVNNTASIKNSVNKGSITDANVNGEAGAGGIVGFCFAASPELVVQCINYGSISSSMYGCASGGLVGMANISIGIENSVNSGEIKGYNNNGGFVGRILPVVSSDATQNAGQLTAKNCLDAGKFSSTYSSANIGGFVGSYECTKGEFVNCLSIGNVNGTFAFAGAFIGNFNSSAITDRSDTDRIVFTNCFYANGTVSTNRALSARDLKTAATNYGSFKLEYGVGEAAKTVDVVGGVVNADTTYTNAMTAYNKPFLAYGELEIARQNADTYTGIAGANFLTQNGGFDFGGTWYLCEGAPVPTKLAIKSATVDTTAPVVYKGYQNSLTATDGLTVRLVAGLNSLDYKYTGFEMYVVKTNGIDTKTEQTDTVYTQINENVDGTISAVTASELECVYLSAITIENLPADADSTYSLVVKPYVTVGDVNSYGTTVVLLVENGAVTVQYAM